MFKPKFTLRAGARVLSGIMLGMLSAALLTLAFPPYNLWVLIWFALVPALVAQYGVMPRQLAALPQAIAIGLWLGLFLAPAFAGLVISLLPPVVFLITLLTAGGERAFNERTEFRWFVPYGAVSWVGIEMIRSLIPVMGTWAFVANTQHSQPWLIQPVSVFSIFGLSLMIMLVNYALALGVLYLLNQRASAMLLVPRIPTEVVRAWGVGVLAVVVGWIGLSLLLYRESETPRVRVAALHYDAGAPWGAPEKFVELSRQAAEAGAQVIVWPELAIEGDPQVSGTTAFKQLAAETNAYLVLGYLGEQGRDAPVTRNEATVLTPGGRFLGVFGKDHPVIFAGETSLTRGTYPTYDTPLGRLGTMICHDMDHTSTARTLTRNGAQLILVPSYNWAGIATIQYTHLVFRAVENRVSAVKPDGGGQDSVIIDPYGRILAAAITPGGDKRGQAVIADVPLGTGDTLVVRLGDWIGWLA
ncbi:MAG: nitrilase-related carbon-nitrogen hydrolase, partial [Anaerolineae bacterium]|nr:nitrilase-related carbon-nitrogen hydrolase [Anaerolineae bacterium]